MNNQATKVPRNPMNMRKLKEQSSTPCSPLSSVGRFRLCSLVALLFKSGSNRGKSWHIKVDQGAKVGAPSHASRSKKMSRKCLNCKAPKSPPKRAKVETPGQAHE